MKNDPATVAAALREMADNLWDVEYRIRVDEDSDLLIRAAQLLEKVSDTFDLGQ